MDHQGNCPGGSTVGVQEDTRAFCLGTIREKDLFQNHSLVMGEITHVFT